MALLMASVLWLTPEINRLRLAGFAQTPEFSKAHGLSNVLYLGQLICVTIAMFSSLLLNDNAKQPQQV